MLFFFGCIIENMVSKEVMGTFSNNSGFSGYLFQSLYFEFLSGIHICLEHALMRAVIE